MSRRLLDLFCGAGGATKGYQRAGFYVVGVDIKPQPRYCGDEFVQADAMTYPLGGFDAIHASPPCQRFTRYKNVRRDLPSHYPDLIAVTRQLLVRADVPWVMENVQGAPLVNPIWLCGSMFGLDVQRHRFFEMSHVPLMLPPCQHEWGPDRFPGGRSVQRGGHSRAPVRATVEIGSWDIPLDVQEKAMGVDWMELDELSEAIPPAYTEWIGRELMRVFKAVS
jgi:DNA (cytosine-5)-methyltransferase 1